RCRPATWKKRRANWHGCCRLDGHANLSRTARTKKRFSENSRTERDELRVLTRDINRENRGGGAERSGRGGPRQQPKNMKITPTLFAVALVLAATNALAGPGAFGGGGTNLSYTNFCNTNY